MSEPAAAAPPRWRLRRRGWLVLAAGGAGVAAAGLSLALVRRRGSPLPPSLQAAPPGALHLGAVLQLGPDGVALVRCPRAELGQGVMTALPRLLADELDLDWAQVRVELADLDPAVGPQFTGASLSVAHSIAPLRRLGATARHMLCQAAAQAWGVPLSQCHTAAGQVHHSGSGRRLAYGALAGRAAALPVPEQVNLKSPAEFKLIGRDAHDVDLPAMLSGRLAYGSDHVLPGSLHAVYVACPVAGGSLAGADLDAVRAQPGVRHCLVLAGSGSAYGLRPGVAILATSFWAAQRARSVLKPRWTPGAGQGDSWAGWQQQAQALLDQPGPGAEVLWEQGNAMQALAQAATKVEARYEHALVAHAAMEPLNCSAHFHQGQMHLYTASQNPAAARDLVAQALGLAPAAVHLHALRCGGAFGRRLASDFIVQAAAIAQQVGAPVKLAWSREDDFAQDHLRPPGWHLLRAGLDAQGRVQAWQHHLVGLGRPAEPQVPAPGGSMDAHEFPAPWVNHALVQRSLLPAHLTTGLWRAPGSHTATWVLQSFIDELAHAAARDPLAFRLQLLGVQASMRPGHLWQRLPVYRVDRMRAVLQAAAAHAGWGQPLPAGQGRGIAFAHAHGGYVAQVVQASVDSTGQLAVQRVVCVCDVGRHIVNPVAARAQVEGAIVDGLSAAWLQQVDVQQGQVLPNNFDRYALLRMAQAPRRVEVHFLPSDFPTTGLGEPALPPLAPALCNAIFQATGVRLRRLPLAGQALRTPA